VLAIKRGVDAGDRRLQFRGVADAAAEKYGAAGDVGDARGEEAAVHDSAMASVAPRSRSSAPTRFRACVVEAVDALTQKGQQFLLARGQRARRGFVAVRRDDATRSGRWWRNGQGSSRARRSRA